jgi:hypothetical protein
MKITALKSSALCLLLATSPWLLPAPPEADKQAAAESEAAKKEAARLEVELQKEAVRIQADAAKLEAELKADAEKIEADLKKDVEKLEADLQQQAAKLRTQNDEIVEEHQIIIQRQGRNANDDDVSIALDQACRALLEAGMREEAESVERLRIRLQDPSGPNQEKPHGWRWTRLHRSGPGGLPGDERVSSEVSGLFREMFEISRSIEEHEGRMRTLNQAKERIVADPGASQMELERLARTEAKLREERISGLNRLRERSGSLTEAIDKATKNLENLPPTDSPAPRVDYMRSRLGGLRAALAEADADDEQFYQALREFAQTNEQVRVEAPRGMPDQPGERVLRLEREIELLQNRLRELDMELRQMRDRPPPPPPGSWERFPDGPAPVAPPRSPELPRQPR